MKKVIIIDDEPLARSIVKEYLAANPELQLVAECNNGFEGVKAIQHHQPDLIILDIQMPKINGFEMLELLDQLPDVIFATAFDEYAIKAFEKHSDYLLKPFSQERFTTAVNKWLDRNKNNQTSGITELLNQTAKQPEEKSRVVVRAQGEINIVQVKDIQYIEAFDDYVKLFTKDSFFLKKKTMNYYEETLDPAHFFRTHRSFIINLDQLSRIEQMEKNSYVALLRSGKKIPLSRTAYADLKAKLGI